jgi:hypothetical protein
LDSFMGFDKTEWLFMCARHSSFAIQSFYWQNTVYSL